MNNSLNSNLFNLPGDRVMRLGSTSFRSFVATLLVVLSSVGIMSAQTTERRGTMSLVEGRKYMVAFPQVWASATEKALPQPMLLLISSKVKAKVRVATPSLINDGQQINKEYTVEANKVFRVVINTSLMNIESETRRGYGIQVTSDKPISVTTYQAWQGNGEMARHLPVEGWGKNYYTMNFYQDRYGTDANPKYRPSQILIMADRDQTVVTYTPTVDTEGGVEAPSTRKGTPQTITLDKGETYLIRSKIFPLENKEFTSDLSGTSIRSNKPIGVVSGHTKVGIMRYPDVLPPTGMFAAEAHFVRNNVHDAMLPHEMAGKQFVTAPIMYTAMRVTGVTAEFGIDDDRGDVIRVVATEDNTTVRAMRQDGSGLKNVWLLAKKGDTRVETSLQEATFWESDKPIIMGQYGKSYAKILPPGGVINDVDAKKDDQTQGHPTVVSGMPMLQYIPSVDRWVEYGVFYAPEGMDNFFNIAFKTTDIGKIKVDGRMLNSFSGSMRPITGTEYAYIRTAIGTGDHVVESVDPSVRWAAWNYGSLDGLAQGRAYGTPIAIDMAIPCNDSLSVNEVIVCGDVDGEGKILPENSPCGSIFAVYAESLTNYELIVDENFISGDKKAKFFVKVLDKKQDATATIRVVSRSGKWVERTYTYVADKIAFDPASVQFGAIAMGAPGVTKQITVTNLSSDRPVEIKNLRMKSFPNIFTPSPRSFTLAPSASQIVDITAVINSSATIIDTVIAELACFNVNLSEVQVRGEAPQIFVGDQTWVNVPASSPGIPKEVEIKNASKVDLIITGYDQSLLPIDNSTGKNFFNPQNLNLPMTLKAGKSHVFTVTYSPNGDAVNTHRVDVPFYSNAKEVDSIAVLIGNGVQTTLYASVDPWNERVIDGIQTAQNITKYTKRVLFGNEGQQSITFTTPLIRGTDVGSFEIVDMGNTGGFPLQVNASIRDKYITVAFTPTEIADRGAERANYVAAIVFPTTSTDTKETEVAADLNGIAWQPQVKGDHADFGRFDISDPAKTMQIPISNDHELISNSTSGDTKGTHAVEITDIRIVGPNPGRFQIVNGPSPTNTWVINPNDAPMQLDVRFIPSDAGTGTWTANYEIVTNSGTDGAAVYTPTYKLDALVVGGTFIPGTGDDTVYIYQSTEMLIAIDNTQGTSKTFTIGQQVNGPDQSRFEILEPINGQLTIDANGTGYVKVRFTPDFVTLLQPGQNQSFLSSAKAQANTVGWRDAKFAGTIDVTDAVNGEVKLLSVSGHGIFLETTNRIRSDYKVLPKGTVDVKIMLDGVPEAIDGAAITRIRTRINYDGKLLRPKGMINGNAVASILTVGTQTAGWTVEKAEKAPNIDMIEVDLVLNTGSPLKSYSPLDANAVPMVKVTFDAFLGKGTDPLNPFKSPIGVYTYTFDGPTTETRYVLIHDIPGEVTVDPLCAGSARLVGVTNTLFSVQPIAPNPVTSNAVINYSIGLDGNVRIVLFNSMGAEILELVNGYYSSGQYEVPLDLSLLPAGTYYYRIMSGPFTSDSYAITVVK